MYFLNLCTLKIHIIIIFWIDASYGVTGIVTSNGSELLTFIILIMYITALFSISMLLQILKKKNKWITNFLQFLEFVSWSKFLSQIWLSRLYRKKVYRQ